MTDFFVYDVFSKVPFGGNQLAVVLGADRLPEADLQRIATEFNFSETSFIFPPKNSAHTARVRIFTPTMEIPFAGHPVVGSAVALTELGHGSVMTLELGVGPMLCKVSAGTAQFTTSEPFNILATPEIALVASALGTDVKHIIIHNHPPVLATLGLAFTITELDSVKALSNLSPDIRAFRTGRDKHPTSLDFAQFAYVRDQGSIRARMFAPLDNIPEDPATGSACATLGALIAQLENCDQKFRISQGEEMGRPSIIDVSTSGTAITVSGAAKRVMQGKLVY